jgi:hypothetical protein
VSRAVVWQMVTYNDAEAQEKFPPDAAPRGWKRISAQEYFSTEHWSWQLLSKWRRCEYARAK